MTLHLRVTTLVDDQQRDLWIRDGRWVEEPQPDAQTLVNGGFAIAGLVDLHSHLSHPQDSRDPDVLRETFDGRRREHLLAGHTLLRDMGAPTDLALSLPRPGDGLPRTHLAGTCLLRETRWGFVDTPPNTLPAAAAAQIRAGARWVKIFEDWPTTWEDPSFDPPFGPDDPLVYPVEVLAETVAAVHDAGGRVGVHVFGRAGADAAVEARVDTIEHGWELREDHFPIMAEYGIVWVPILAISQPMIGIADRLGNGWQREWVQERMAAMRTLIPAALEAGVTVLAGTDWFPAVRLSQEVRALHERGMPAHQALGAAAWNARKYLGEAGIVPGAPADLVVYGSDPRDDLDVLDNPSQILLEGTVIHP